MLHPGVWCVGVLTWKTAVDECEYDLDWEYVDQFDVDPHIATCKYCGAGGLTWGMTKFGWRLFNAGVLHSCLRNRSPQDDFGDLADEQA